MKVLSNRQINIIKQLQRKGIQTANMLGEFCHVSSKTIRNEINIINDICSNSIISHKSQGYELNENQKDLKEVIKNSMDENENKYFDFMKHFVYSEKLNIYDLCDELYISESNLLRMIDEINTTIQLRNPEIKILRKDDCLYLSGDERSSRQALLSTLIYNIEKDDMEVGKYRNYFNLFDIEKLENYTNIFLEKENLVFRGIEVFSLIFHIAIMLERIYQGNNVVNPNYIESSKETKRLAIKYYEGLRKIIDVDFNENELEYLSILFSGRMPHIQEEKITEIKLLVRNILVKVLDIYNVNFIGDQKLVDNLIIHILGLCKRIETHAYLRNPIINDIKKSYPFLFDISVFIAEELEKYFKVNLYEDEIGYITLHLMGAAERQHIANTKRVVIISPIGMSGMDYFKSRLAILHEYNIEILSILNDVNNKKIKALNPELVITFLDKEVKDFPFYYSNDLISEKEKEEIYHLLKSVNKKDKLLGLFDKDLFFKDVEVNNKEEVIHMLCEAVKDKGYVDSSYEELVLKRDRIATLAFGGNFAIPHAVVKAANKDIVAIAILKNHIIWNLEKVKIVFLLCPAKNSENNFEPLYDKFADLLNSDDLSRKLIKSKNFREFIDLFLG